MSANNQKVVVIAGAGGYIGSALVKAFEKAGWKVVGLRRDVDITDTEGVRTYFAKLGYTKGSIDACIHAVAPPLVRKPLLSLTDTEFSAQIDVAARGAFVLFQEAMKRMRPGGTLIGITTSAIEPSRSMDAVGSYVPAKYALRGVLRVLAAQLAPHIRVYAIAPGFLPGGLNRDMPEKVRELIESKLPAITTPEEIAALALELGEGSAIASGSSIRMPGREVHPL
jgi:NAD(P)-dependent dehydrogenase (short-subunit alcohol dehydrogenase family)